MFLVHKIVIAYLSLISIALGQEQLSQERIKALLKDKIQLVEELAAHPLIKRAVEEQNAKGISLDEVKRIDQEWRSTKSLTSFKKSLQTTLVGKLLKRKILLNSGIYSEAFLTDNQGANVAAYPITSDYWQGDEKKWIESFDNGKGKVYIGPITFDESTRINATQISAPVVHEDKAIGVLIVGIKLDFMRLRELKDIH